MANLSVTAASVVKGNNAKVKEGISGAAIGIGQTLYADGLNSGVLKLADADLSAAAGNVVGVALTATSGAGQPVKYTDDDDDFTPGATLAVGTNYVQSATAGAIAPAADLASGMYSSFLFVAKSTTKAKLRVVNSGAAVP